MTHSDEVIACAALRDRPRPVLITATPAMANGTRRMNARQSANESEEPSAEVIRGPRREEGGPWRQAPVRGFQPRVLQSRTRTRRHPATARLRQPRSRILRVVKENRRFSFSCGESNPIID